MIINFGYIPIRQRSVNIVTKFFGWLFVTRRLEAAVVIKMLSLGEEDLFLDLGCGSGNFAYEISKKYRSVGVDLNLDLKNIAFAQGRREKIDFLLADGFNLPFKNNSFDKIMLGGTLQAIKHDYELLRECRRIMKNDGILVSYVIQERMAIKKIYDADNTIIDILINLFRLPQNYSEFERDYSNRLRVAKFYSTDTLMELMEKSGFKVIDVEFAPKTIGSSILDIILILSRCLNIPGPNHPVYFPILYPIIYFADKLSKDKLKGNEFIMKSRRDDHINKEY